jgi:predicted PurR-regulated permease PerM
VSDSNPVTESEVQQEAISTAKWLRLLIVIATLLSIVAVCAVMLRLGASIHHTLVLFALGGLLAYAIDPLVEAIRRPGKGGKHTEISRTFSVLLVFFSLFLCFSGAVWWLGGQAASQFKTMQEDAPKYHDRALALARNFDDQLLKPRNIDFSLEQTIEKPPKEVTNFAEKASQEALPFLAHTASDVGESAVVIFIALYLLIFSVDMKQRFNRMLPMRLLVYAEAWETDANRILGGFVRGQVILALVTGGFAAVGLLLIGVHLWLVIGLFVVVASLIPVFGPYIAAFPAIIAALVGPTHLSPIAGAITVLVLFVVLNEVGSKVLYPKLVGQALNLHEVVVLFVLFAGLEIGGIMGTLFAAPVAALAVITVTHLYRLWQELPERSMAEEMDQQPSESKGIKLFKHGPKPAE